MTLLFLLVTFVRLQSKCDARCFTCERSDSCCIVWMCAQSKFFLEPLRYVFWFFFSSMHLLCPFALMQNSFERIFWLVATLDKWAIGEHSFTSVSITRDMVEVDHLNSRNITISHLPGGFSLAYFSFFIPGPVSNSKSYPDLLRGQKEKRKHRIA